MLCLALQGLVFDVEAGENFYGMGGPYEVFAGRDASRGLATGSLDKSAVSDTFDDLSDLTADQIKSLESWTSSFKSKYSVVGRLVRNLHPNKPKQADI
eukprot:Pgem_evm1s13543